MRFLSMCTAWCLLLIISIFPAHAAPAEKPSRFWQLVVTYDLTQGLQILNADLINQNQKYVSQPGMPSAAEVQSVNVRWFRAGNEIYRTRASLAIGNRFQSNATVAGLSVLRVPGPDSRQAGDRLELELLGAEQRLGVTVADFQAVSDKRRFEFTVGLSPAPQALGTDGPIAVSKYVDTGADSNRFVLVVVGDGYRQEDISSGKYSSDAQATVQYLGSQSPWDQLINLSNVYIIDVVSNQEGADDPCAEGGACVPQSVDTYFDTSFGINGIERLLAASRIGEARAIAAADSLVGAGVWDAVVMVVNSSKYGGSGGTVTTTSVDPSSPEIVVHELGHSIAGLADEYEDAYPGYPEGTPERNVDSDGSNPKWAVWIDQDVPLPTPLSDLYQSVVGAFEGARYQSSGVYRPMASCKMRVLGAEFCPICKESIFESVLEQVSLFDRVTPAQGSNIKLTTKAKKFSISAIDLQQISSKWSLCGKVIARNVSQVKLTRKNLAKTSCVLKVSLTLSSDYIRQYSVASAVSWKLRR